MEIYLVGGAVRDELLGRPVVERDWVVVGGSVAALVDAGYRQVGKDFPVFLHPQSGDEYALARTERKTGPGHTGFEVHADPSVTLEQDLERRDLTINAMARSEDGLLIDPYGGQADLEARLLRHVSSAFAEDPLRVFRVARFAAQLPAFELAEETRALMAAMARDRALDELSAERVWAEFLKALEGVAAQRFIEVLKTCGALNPWFQEFENHEPVALPLPEAPQRFAAFVSGLTPDALERIAARLKTPRRHLRLARWVVQHAIGIAAWEAMPARALYAALNECRAFKPDTELSEFLTVVEQLHGVSLERLQSLVTQIAAEITPADFQAKGLGGASLGAALDAARIEALRRAQKISRVDLN